MRKLDPRGVAHDVLLVAFVAIFAIGGVGYVVASHADAPVKTREKRSQVNTGDSSKGLASQLDFKKCSAPKPVVPQPADNKLGVLNDYFKFKDADKQANVFKDHTYVVGRFDKTQADDHYCYQGPTGYAYLNAVEGTKPLYIYVTESKDRSYVSDSPANPQAANGTQFVRAGTHGGIEPIAYISKTQVKNTKPLYRFYNSVTKSYYLTTDTTKPLNEQKGSKTLANYGYVQDGEPLGYIWTKSKP